MARCSKPSSRVHFDADFPGGNILVNRIRGGNLYLSPDQRDSERWWFYWYFRVTGAAGKTLFFHFGGESPIGPNGPATSSDGGRTWTWMGTESLFNDASFQYSFPDSAGEVRFCFAIPYLESHLHRFLNDHAGNPALLLSELCRTRKNRVVERLHVGRLDGKARIRVLVAARHHSCEMMANYVLEGLLDSMLSDTKIGRWYRQNVEVMAIPFVDKDGVEDGDQGKLRSPHDHNRDYQGESLYPSVRAIRQIIPAWSDGCLRVALDLHCPWIRGPRNEAIYIVGSPDATMWQEQTKFGSILEAVQQGQLVYRACDNLPFGKDWNTEEHRTAGKSFCEWAAELPGMWLVASYEIPYARAGDGEVNPANARAFGWDLSRALLRYLVERAPGWG